MLAEQLKGRKVYVGSSFDVMVNYGRKGGRSLGPLVPLHPQLRTEKVDADAQLTVCFYAVQGADWNGATQN